MMSFDLTDNRNRQRSEDPGRGLYRSDDVYVFEDGRVILRSSEEGQAYEALYDETKGKLEQANKVLSVIDKIMVLIGEPYKETITGVRGKKEKGTVQKISDLLDDADLTLPSNVALDNPTALDAFLTQQQEAIEQNIPDIEALFNTLNRSDSWEPVSEAIANPGSVTAVSTEPVSTRTIKAPVPTEPQTVQGVWSGVEAAQEMQAQIAKDTQIVESELAKGDDAFANWAGFLTQGGTGQVEADSELKKEEKETEKVGAGVSYVQQRQADRSAVQTLLAEQFGGSAFFFDASQDDLRIGLTADGTPVALDDPDKVTDIPVINYIVNNGITDTSRVLTLMQKTEWWQNTNSAMRLFDIEWAQLSEPGKTEYLDGVLTTLRGEAQFLGFELDGEREIALAKQILRLGESQDQDYIRGLLVDELEFATMSNEISGFGAGRDALKQLANQYYTPLSDTAANQWAEDIYAGVSTELEFEQMLKHLAVSTFPTLDRVINEMGVTPQLYFEPYKQSIENMLGRPVDMLGEFSDVVQYIPDGGTEARPMTFSEVQKYVRALPEWQQTDSAKESARALAFAIGQTFGEVA
tara:strand:- start:969 stop:2708 length:1740 start_codon:yes stop_codon:yes gene_type:complete